MGSRPRAYTTIIEIQSSRSPGHYTKIPGSVDYVEARADATAAEVAHDALQLHLHEHNPQPDRLRARVWEGDFTTTPILRTEFIPAATAYPRNVFTWLVQVSNDGRHWTAEADEATGTEQFDGTAKELARQILQVRLDDRITTTDAAGNPITPEPGRLRVLVWEGGLRGEVVEATAVYAN